MEFGFAPEQHLNAIDFSLPIDPASNNRVLKGKPAMDPEIYLGCAKWGRKEWVGKIYPPKTKEKDFLQQYTLNYNSIELNSTHYKIYGPVGIAKWAAKAAGKKFRFCPKMYKGITHRGRLRGKDFLTNEFLRGVIAFGQYLGPVFIQLSDAFGPKRKEELFTYLRSLPDDIQFFVEVRHRDWFADSEIRKELFTTLHILKMGAVITDTAGRRDCCHMELTIPKTMIRFVGNNLHPTDTIRCDAWVRRIRFWLKKGLEEVYFFMHMHDESLSPELTAYLVDRLNKVCGFQLQKPQFISNGQGPGTSHKS